MTPPAVEQQERAKTGGCAVETPLPCKSALRPNGPLVSLAQAPAEMLRAIVRSYGTPTYAYDLRRVRSQAAKLRDRLPHDVEILYSLKANASLGLCGVLAECGVGADVASAGELVTALAAGFAPERIMLTGPDKSPAVLAELKSHPQIVLSLDSVSELRQHTAAGLPHRAVLRLRPDFSSFATCSAGPDSRFGLTLEDLPACRPFLARVKVIGFHVFSGSQVLAVEGIREHLRGALMLARRAAGILGITPQLIDIGGGFGIPYGPGEDELDLTPIAAELRSLVAEAAPARLVMELGRYFVAQAGWYLTTVLAEQTRQGRKAVVVDGGSHQRTDMCGVGLQHKTIPLTLHAITVTSDDTEELAPTDVLGCLSLPADVLVEAGLLPLLSPGDVLAFPIAGAYGLYAAPCLFHCHPAPAEVAFDGDRIELLRARLSTRSVLDGQQSWSIL